MFKTFQIYHKDYNGDVPIEIKARDHEDAAERYAEYYDQDDHYLTRDDCASIDIDVIDAQHNKKTFMVSASIDVDYIAQEKI